MSEICPACATALPGPEDPGYLVVPVWLSKAGIACSEKCAREIHLRRDEP